MKLSKLCRESPKFRVIINGVIRGEVRHCTKSGQVNKEDALEQLRNAYVQGRLTCKAT